MDVLPPKLSSGDEDARKIGHTSARLARAEVLAQSDRRRSWTLEQKRAIVGESLGAGLTPAEVARRYKISTGQLYTWRQQLLENPGAVISRMLPRFAAVELASSQPPVPAAVPAEAPMPMAPPPPRPDGLIEIQLACGVSLRVDAHVDSRALRKVLDVLASR